MRAVRGKQRAGFIGIACDNVQARLSLTVAVFRTKIRRTFLSYHLNYIMRNDIDVQLEFIGLKH